MATTGTLPFIVQTVAGSYCGDYEDMAQAKANANDRNERAEQLGIKARYEAKAR